MTANVANEQMDMDPLSAKDATAAKVVVREMSKDEHHLATLGYKQVFIRSFGMFENWAATCMFRLASLGSIRALIHHILDTTMNFVSGMPVLFGFAMYTGGPQAAFANWTVVGGLSTVVSLAMAEIAASLPTAGGRYKGYNPLRDAQG